MAHDEKNTGSKSTMRRTLMGGAIVSTLLIASLAPASASCLMNGNLNYNYQVTYQQSQPQTQAAPRQNIGTSFGQSSSGAKLRWAPRDDFRLSARYGSFSQERREPQANRGGQISPTAEEYLSPRFGAVVIPQAQNRYRNQFGGVRTGGNQNLQWGQGLNNFQPNANLARQVQRVDVVGFQPRGLYQIPNLNARGDRASNPRFNRREVIINVTPRLVRNNESEE